MKLVILSVGRPKNPLYKNGIEEYHRRIGSCVPFQWEAVRSSGGKSSVASLREEGAAILKRINERDLLALLEDSGNSFTSEGFSRWLFEKLRGTGGRVILCVGGPFGVSGAVKARADVLVSLSPMTLTHDMSLLLLFEQIYRAIAIEKGTGYHH